MATIDAHHMRDREMEGVATGPISRFFALGMVDIFDDVPDDVKPVVVVKEAVEER